MTNTLPYQPHSDTSREAAEKAAPRAMTDSQRVLALFQKWPAIGFTDEELIRFTGMNPSTARPRRIDLVKAGLVRDSGRRRKTLSGSWAVVWEVVPKPPEQMRLI